MKFLRFSRLSIFASELSDYDVINVGTAMDLSLPDNWS
jgi:hypothetical protein